MMIIANFFHAFLDSITLGIDLLWRAFAFILDGLSNASGLQAALVLLAIFITIVAAATGMQRETNKKLTKPKARPINPLLLELRYSLIGIPFRALVVFFTLPLRLLDLLFSSTKKDENAENTEKADQKDDEPPALIPTLGPSYLWAALICAGLYLLSLVFEPLLRWQLDVPNHFPTWQFLLFGHRPELAPFLPLETYPFAATVTITTFWLLLWFTTARLIRLYHFEVIGKNIIAQAQSPQVLPSWRTYFAVGNLAEKDSSFAPWAKWLSFIALPFLLLAFIATGGDPYRVEPAAFAMAFVVWTAWTLHLRLEGVYRPETPPEIKTPQKISATAAGWTDVLADLRRLHEISLPALSHPIRDVESLAFTNQDLQSSELISPLLTELLPDPQRLTAMQADVLTHLSRHSFVHVDPPSDTRTLELGGQRTQEHRELRHPNQIVIAPEGSGKTTLAMLAAFNTALTHTRSTLMIVRSDDIAQKTAAHFQATVQPSTLRWNLRVRRVGGDLIEDLARGIIPDLLVCDLQELVTTLLEDVETYRPFLNNLALITIDDIETFCGPVETHAQLAIRRLHLRLRALRSPIFLLLASESMEDLPTWARSLCGIDAIPRYFSTQYGASQKELARTIRQNVDQGGALASNSADDQAITADGRRRKHLIYSIDAFRTASQRYLSVMDIIEACEALAVPWHYRTAGDDRRHLGRSTLPLRDEPQSYTDDPLQAALIFVDGHATAVERELMRLRRAGAHFTSRTSPIDDEEKSEEESEEKSEEANEGQLPQPDIEPIAFITIVDPAEEIVFDHADSNHLISDLLPTLPRPFLRPPSGYLTHRHLTSELAQHWTEVEDLLDLFGKEIAPLLRELTSQGSILLDERTTLEPGRKTYEKRVFLRGLEAQLYAQNPTQNGAERFLLPPPVENVEVAARQHVTIRERTTLAHLGHIDAESARQRFYPGRIFETYRGRHIVVDYAGDNARDQAFQAGDIIAEPFLGEEITSPRRHIQIEIISENEEIPSPRPLFLGDFPIGTGLFRVNCHIQHQATFRLHPRSAEIRQRIYVPEEERTPFTLQTHALAIFPSLTLEGRPKDTPLTLNAARHIAAALRTVIPLIYRGASSAIAVALHTGANPLNPQATLARQDAFFLFDLHSDGNGAARAIKRDGIAPLLRLAHHLLVALPDTTRLLASHDEIDGPMTALDRAEARKLAIAWFADHLEGIEAPHSEEKAETQEVTP